MIKGFKINLYVIAVVGMMLLAACTARQNGLSIAPPKVYSDAETRKSLTIQRDRVVAAAQQTSVGALQQFSGLRQVQQGGLRGGFSGAAGVAMPTPSTSTSVTLPTLVVTPAAGFGALITESLDDLAAKEAEIEGLRLLYAGDITLAGENARIYLVRLDIMLNPSRQNYATYPWRLFDCLHLDNDWYPQCRGLRNYTEDFQAVVRFSLPTLGKREAADFRAPVEVYAVSPANQTLTALDSMASMQGLELAAAAAWNGLSGQGEYQTRAEEQFAEQRKFPLIQGIIDSPTEFHFIFNPRRRTVRRSAFISWIPGVGRYSTSLSLDAGVRRVYVYLVVRDPENLETDLAALHARRDNIKCPTPKPWDCCKAAPTASPTPNSVVSGVGQEHTYRLAMSEYERRHFEVMRGDLISNVKATSTPSPSSTPSGGSKTISFTPTSFTPTATPPALALAVRGRYVRYGNPYRNDPLFFEDPTYPPKVCSEEGEWCDSDRGARFLDVSLPVEHDPVNNTGDQRWTVAANNEGKVLGPVLHIEPPADCRGVDFRRVKVRVFDCPLTGDCTASPSALEYRGRSGKAPSDIGMFELIPLPAKPGAPSIQMQLYVDAGRCAGWTKEITYTGPWKPATPTPAKPAKLSGKAGSPAVVSVSPVLDAGEVRAVRTILFGQHVARVIDTGKRLKPSDPYTFTVIVPESLVREVDLLAEVDLRVQDDTLPQLSAPTREITSYVKLGTFAYE